MVFISDKITAETSLNNGLTNVGEVKNTIDGNWLPQYDNLELIKLNQITNKAAFIYIEDLNTYYTAEEIISAEVLSRDCFLLGTYNIITLDNKGSIFKIPQDMYQTITAQSLSKYDYYFGDGLSASIIDRFKDIFKN